MDNGAGSYRRFLDGDESAFDEIIKTLFDSLVFFINRYLQDLDTAEELAIDVFADLIAYKNRYNFKVSLKTYLFMIGRSRALNYIKRKKIIEFVPLDTVEQILPAKDTPEEFLLTKERKEEIECALIKLPKDMQVVLHLIYFEDMTYEQAAKVMKKKVKQIDNLLYQAKRKLRIILEKDGELLQ